MMEGTLQFGITMLQPRLEPSREILWMKRGIVFVQAAGRYWPEYQETIWMYSAQLVVEFIGMECSVQIVGLAFGGLEQQTHTMVLNMEWSTDIPVIPITTG